VEIAADGIRLHGDGTAVTLNGIAQGFAADAVASVLARHGIASALIDTGEISALGTHPDKDAWTIGIKHPRAPGEWIGLAGLHGRCLATSGDYETSFATDFSQHHLLDPRTGRSPAELASVSVIAPTALAADALSTAAFLLGPEAGMRLVQATTGADALFVAKDGARVQTPGFPMAG
jgi:thiamine biosynthesis lipoprotein